MTKRARRYHKAYTKKYSDGTVVHFHGRTANQVKAMRKAEKNSKGPRFGKLQIIMPSRSINLILDPDNPIVKRITDAWKTYEEEIINAKPNYN